MKRFIMLILLVLLCAGCININNSNYDAIINAAVSSNSKIYNNYRNGYKFYLPSGLYVSSSDEKNEVIKSEDATFYLYIDIISYLNQSKNTYEANTTSIYSSLINYQNKSGYIEINKKNDKYLVEIMYNYAKIEVMVDEEGLKNAVAEAIIVLSSIYYNDGILKNLTASNVLNYNEETIDIFETSGSDNSNFVEYVEEFDNAPENVIPDYDMIN